MYHCSQYMCGILLIPLLLYFLYATYSLLDALAVLLDKHVRTSLTEFNIEACMVSALPGITAFAALPALAPCSGRISNHSAGHGRPISGESPRCKSGYDL